MSRPPTSPSLDGSWSYDATAKQIRITIAQTQDGEPYRLPLEFGVTPAAGTGTPAPAARVERVEMTSKQATFSIAAEAEPASVAFDPETWLLADRVTFVKR
jgi:hypothetical protein